MENPNLLIFTREDINSVKLSILTQIIVILKSLVMTPVSWFTFTIFYLKGILMMPSTVVNVIFLSEKIKILVKNKNANL